MCKGTRQGGLSSPFLFNLHYQDLINELSQCTGVELINIWPWCCYADDLMLTSLTLSGLQHLIEVADKYITNHGLRFNPLKTECCYLVTV